MKLLAEESRVNCSHCNNTLCNFFDKLLRKKNNTMNDAVSGTEAIRTWDEHRIGIPKLCEKYETNIVTGLTDDQAAKAH